MICLNICIFGVYYSSKNKISNRELLIFPEWNSTICIFYHWKLLTDFLIWIFEVYSILQTQLQSFGGFTYIQWSFHFYQCIILLYLTFISSIDIFWAPNPGADLALYYILELKKIRIHSRCPNIAYNLVQKITYGP